MSIADWLQTGLLIATILGLVLSIYYLRKQMRMMLFAEYTKRYMELKEKLPANVFDEDYSDSESLKQSENRKYIRMYFELCGEEYYLYKRGLLPKDAFNYWKTVMDSVLQKPAFRESWSVLKEEFENFDKECYNDSKKTKVKFSKFVNDKMGNTGEESKSKKN